MANHILGDLVDETFQWEGWSFAGRVNDDIHPDVYEVVTFIHQDGRECAVNTTGALRQKLAEDHLWAFDRRSRHEMG